MEREIGISTKADLSGVQALRKEMEAIRDLTREIAKNGIPFSRGPGGGATAQQMAIGEHVQRIVDARGQVLASSQGSRGIAKLWHQAHAQRTQQQQGGQSGQISGQAAAQLGQSLVQDAGILAPYMEQFMGQMTPSQVARTSSSIGRVRRAGGSVSAGAQFSTPRASGTPRHIARAFSTIGSNTVFGNLNPFQQQEYGAAYQSWLAGDTTAPQAFFAEHGMAPQVAQGALAALSPRRSGGGTGPSGFGNAASGAMGALLGGDVGGALGSLTSMLPYAAVAGGILDFGVSSFNQWKTQGLALSDISKQSLSAGDSLTKFMNAVDAAGQALGYLPAQVAAVANILSPALGNIGTQGLVNAVQQTLGFSRTYGLSATNVAQAMASAAQMGLTIGPNSVSQQKLLALVGNMTYQGGMQGRTGQVLSALLSTMQNIEGTSVVPSGLWNVASQLTALSAAGGGNVRGLQGAAGAQLLSQVASGIANPGLGAAGQMLEYQSLGLGGWYRTQFAQQMGPGYVLPSGPYKGTSVLQADINGLQRIFGKAQIGSAASGFAGLTHGSRVLESVIGNMWGISMPQAGALLSVFGSGHITPVTGAFNKLLKATGGNLSGSQENIALLAQLYAAHSQKQIQAVAAQFRHAGGKESAALSNMLRHGAPISKEQAALGSAIAGANLTNLTQAENVQKMVATITNAQISIVNQITHPGHQPPRPTKSDPYNPGRFGSQLFGSGGSSSTPTISSNVLRWKGNIAAAINSIPPSERAKYLTPQLIEAMIQEESGGNPNAKSPAGAMGLMQLMSSTAKGYGVNPWNPAQNISAGVRDINSYLRQYGNITDALAAYNEGPGNLSTHGTGPSRGYIDNVLALEQAAERIGKAVAKHIGPYLGTGPRKSSLNGINVNQGGALK